MAGDEAKLQTRCGVMQARQDASQERILLFRQTQSPLPASRYPAHWRKQAEMVCRCRKAERTGRFWRVAISGIQPSQRPALCLGGLRQGRSATWRCDASRYALEDPVPCPIFGVQMLVWSGLIMEPFGYTSMPVDVMWSLIVHSIAKGDS